MNEALQAEANTQTDKAKLFWQLQFGGWGAFASVQFLLSLSYLSLVNNLKNNGAFFISGLLLSLLPRAVYQRLHLRRMRVVPAVLVMLLTCIPVGTLLEFAMEGMRTLLHAASQRPDNLMDWINAIFTWSFFMMGWSLFYIGINYRLDAEAERRRAIRAEALAQQARLQALRAQLEPHFLFNTLNAISTLVLENDAPAALRMINTLGEFLRMTLDKAGTEEISVAQELEFARRYAEIQMARFNDRLSIAFDIDPATMDAAVPALILQPLVENAVKHGVLSQEKSGTVNVTIRQHTGRLHINVQDDGPGFDHKLTTYGVGLSNTVARLEALYGGTAYFSVGAMGSGASVHIDMPSRKLGDAS